jgi:SAM-dependent methyltransferase
LELVLSLAPTPPANDFVKASELNKVQPTFPLDVFFCNQCAHVQLLDVVDPELLFRNYVYVSGTSPVFVQHFKAYAEEVSSRFDLGAQSFVIDVGSNDGTLLKQFKARGTRVLGIDPAKNIAQTATANGIPTLPEFFNPQVAAQIVGEHGLADLVVANNVFAHIDDLDSIARGVRSMLKPNGIFTFEVSYLVDVFTKTLFDTIYHEHLCYHSVKPLVEFLARNDLELIDAQRVDSHGGSLRAIAQPKGGKYPRLPSVQKLIEAEAELGLYRPETYREFSKNIDSLKKELKTLLGQLRSQGKKVAGFGAPAKATTLMHHFELGKEALEFIIDDSPLKQGLFTPGYHVPVVPSSAIQEKKPDYLVILAWNFADSIVSKNQEFINRGGHFVVPLPKVQVI